MSKVFLTELRSSRLILRRFKDGDLAALCAYRSLPEVARFQSWESFGPDDAAGLIAEHSHQEPNVPGKWFQLAIVRSDSGELIGDCGLHCPVDDPSQLELGITLAPEHQGYGYATEALSTAIEFAFTSLGKRRITAVTDAENAPAAALFLRLGFRQEGHFLENVLFKGRWGSEFAFGLLRREWPHLTSKS
jgi:RimJ/RimL family protein N-acetyltransferase